MLFLLIVLKISNFYIVFNKYLDSIGFNYSCSSFEATNASKHSIDQSEDRILPIKNKLTNQKMLRSIRSAKWTANMLQGCFIGRVQVAKQLVKRLNMISYVQAGRSNLPACRAI